MQFHRFTRKLEDAAEMNFKSSFHSSFELELVDGNSKRINRNKRVGDLLCYTVSKQTLRLTRSLTLLVLYTQTGLTGQLPLGRRLPRRLRRPFQPSHRPPPPPPPPPPAGSMQPLAGQPGISNAAAALNAIYIPIRSLRGRRWANRSPLSSFPPRCPPIATKRTAASMPHATEPAVFQSNRMPSMTRLASGLFID